MNRPRRVVQTDLGTEPNWVLLWVESSSSAEASSPPGGFRGDAQGPEQNKLETGSSATARGPIRRSAGWRRRSQPRRCLCCLSVAHRGPSPRGGGGSAPGLAAQTAAGPDTSQSAARILRAETRGGDEETATQTTTNQSRRHSETHLERCCA